ncbi:MAG: hypothetical protein ABL933_07970 [Methyloglobulus sp.]|nr:hypothetical protein [Methyloglobulus sp.]
MASMLHGNAKTTPLESANKYKTLTRASQRAVRYSLNEKTVLKWKHTEGVHK